MQHHPCVQWPGRTGRPSIGAVPSHRVTPVAALLAALTTALAAALTAAPVGSGATGVLAGPRDVVPASAKRLGIVCRLHTPVFRLWWTDTPGAAGALAGVDGSCATAPPAVAGTASAAQSAYRRALALGFPAMTGDAPPRFVRYPALTRLLLRTPPAARVAPLRGLTAVMRGQYLAGLPATTRARILAGITPVVRRRFLADAERALRGRPTDFTGGDRRVDITLDGSGATGIVSERVQGVTSCQMIGSGPGLRRATFRSTELVVFAPTEAAPRAVIAHELFHVVQCNLDATRGAPDLLAEGTAEWFAARAEPVDFAPPVQSTENSSTVTGGGSRVIGFCTGFDPAGTGRQPYNAWGVWQALDAGAARPARVIAALRAVAGRRDEVPAATVVSRVGAAAWTGAVRQAAQSLCVNLRSPYGDVLFPTGIRDFFGAGSPTAAIGAPVSVTVPQWGTASVRASWGTGPTAVTLRITSPQADAAALAAAVAVGTSAGPLAVVVRDGIATVDVTGPAIAAGGVVLTIANPRAADAAIVNVTVEAVTPPA